MPKSKEIGTVSSQFIEEQRAVLIEHEETIIAVLRSCSDSCALDRELVVGLPDAVQTFICLAFLKNYNELTIRAMLIYKQE
jgi:hypothetical protein